MEGPQSRVNSKRKLTALPLLIFLFVFSFSLLTRLVVDQDRTIDAQSSMIHSLLRDNVSLSKYHKHAAALPKHSADRNNLDVEFEAPVVARHSPANSGETSSNKVELDQFPSARVLQHQTPSNQVLSNEVQSKVGPQANSKANHKARKRAMPVAPPAPLTDPSDKRRVKFSI